MDNSDVSFRYSLTAVTDESPSLLPGAFTFDSESLALYLDTDTQRVQVKDPLKLSLTGGSLTGTLSVVDSEGTVSASISSEGVISGEYLETCGSIALNTPPDLYAVLDSSGRIRTRTKEQMIQDLGIANVGSLGSLAYVDYVISDYTPEGEVSKPSAVVSSSTESVVSSITPGDPSVCEVSGEVLSLVSGTKTAYTSTSVVKSVDVDVSKPTFVGKKSQVKSVPEN